MNLIKKLFLICVTLIFIALVSLAVWIWVTLSYPEHLKAQIVKRVYEQSGIKLQINGPVHLNIRKRLGFNFADVSFQHPGKGFMNYSGHSPKIAVFFTWRSLLDWPIQVQQINFSPLILEIKPVTLSGEVQVNLPAQTLSAQRLKISGGHIHADGEISGEQIFHTRQVNGRFALQQVSLNDLLALFSDVAHLNAVFNHATIQLLWTPGRLSGSINSEVLTIDHYRINNFSTQFRANPLQITLLPIHGSLAGGTVDGRVQIDKWLQTPHYQVEAVLQQAEISQLIRSDILSGMVNLSARINFDAYNGLFTPKNLNGNLLIMMSQGVLHHIDLLKPLQALGETGITHFTALRASGTIKEGVFTNNDLNLDSPQIQATGHGTLNLSDQRLKYELSVNARGEVLKGDIAVSAPMTISGTLNHPKVKLQTDKMSITIRKLPELNKQLNDVLKNELKSLFGHHHHKHVAVELDK